MKRTCLSIITILLFIALFVYQVQHTSAQDDDNLITPPITSPTDTPTITMTPSPTLLPTETPTSTPSPTPTGTPVTQFAHSISGHITYAFWGRFFHSFNRIIPATDVTVKIRAFFSGKTYSTQTDQNGNYSVSVPDGFYQVQPMSNDHFALFTPPLRFENVSHHSVTANFQGLIFSF